MPSTSAHLPTVDPIEVDWPSVKDGMFTQRQRVICLDATLFCLADAFAARHMTDLGPEIDSFTCFTWRITDYQSSDKKTTSPEFECGGHKWFASLLWANSKDCSSWCVVLQEHSTLPYWQFKRPSE